MKEFLEYIVRYLVERPDMVRVTEAAAEGRLILRVEVADGDRGKVIGKHGRTAEALRTLVTAAAARHGQRALLEIVQ
jgi:predicted RNA-binding protein YlqC (UPF0109 family)